MGDRIVVMKDGVIQQADTPQTLYDPPKNIFVAGFIGSPQMNFIDAKIIRYGNGFAVAFGPYSIPIPEGRGGEKVFGEYVDKPVVFGIRPEDLHAEPDMLTATNDAALVEVSVELAELMGAEIYVHGTCAGIPVVVRTPSHISVQTKDTLRLTGDTNKIQLFDKETKYAIGL